jgi:hypothetical protein
MKLVPLLAMLGLMSCGGRVVGTLGNSPPVGDDEESVAIASCVAAPPIECALSCLASDPCDAYTCPDRVSLECPSIEALIAGTNPSVVQVVFCCPRGK